MANITHQKINGGVHGLITRLKDIKGKSVGVGIIDAGKHETSDDKTVATIAYEHEFGTNKVPERSFMRATFLEQQDAIIALQKRIFQGIQKDTISIEQGLGILGEFFSGEIKEKIIEISSPPNSAETIEKKGSSNPLIDTGQMKNSITYEVNN